MISGLKQLPKCKLPLGASQLPRQSSRDKPSTVHVERGARHEFQVYPTITGNPTLERFLVIKGKKKW